MTNIPIETTFELVCDDCGAEYDITYIEGDGVTVPIYCPFCGCDINLEDLEDDDDFDDEIEELDFDDDDRRW